MTSKQTENLKKEGKSITYSYDPQRRRLENLVVNAKAGTIMDNAYSYDAVSNVLSVKNNAPLPQSGKAGGQMSHSYTYDPLYRLSSATGTYTGADNKTASYTLAMGYDNMHRITSKKQHLSQTGVQFDGTLNAGYELSYTYGREEGKKFQLDNVRDINYRTEEVPTGSTTINNGHKYEYDANGNLVYINTSRVKRDGKEDDKASEQKFKWDEENRLLAVDENGFVSNYWYDADGERTVKTSGENEAIYVNSEFSGGNTGTARFSLYVSPYLVAGQGGKYTKHIYIGSQRIVSKLGDLASYGADPRRIPYAGNEADGLTINYKDKYAQQLQSIKDNYKTFDIPYTGKDNNDYVNGQGFCCDDGTPEAAQARSMARAAVDGNFKPNEEYEKMQFYYHPDHLGSSSYITNLDGEVSQHIEYVPFGEVFIEERNNTWNTPYLFNAKELDEETGMYYYGARYYDPRLSLWMSVDPISNYDPRNSENYLDGEHNGGVYYSGNLNPYTYCYLNPVIYIDPNGMQSKFWTRTWGALRMVGGTAEAVIGGVGGVLTAETGVGLAAGYAVLMHGVDNMVAGAEQMWTGETQRSLTQKGITAGARALGVDDNTATAIGDYGDIALGVIGGGASSASSLVKSSSVYKTEQLLSPANLSSRTNVATKEVNGLLQAGNASYNRELTAVGRALQKHGSRTNSIFPKVTGNAAAINAQGESVLKGILTNPNVVKTVRHHARFGEILEYRIPGGQGARFTSDGKTFIGFLE